MEGRVGAKGGGRGDSEKKGEGSLPVVLVLRPDADLYSGAEKQGGWQTDDLARVPARKRTMYCTVHKEENASTPYIFPGRPPYRSIFLDVLFTKAVITQVRSTYIPVLYM